MRIRFIMAAIVIAIMAGCTQQRPMALRPGLLYVSHIALGHVTVIDPATNNIIGKIQGGRGPCSVDLSPESSRGYIANYTSNDVTVFDKKTGLTIVTVPAGSHPSHLILTADANLLLIGHESIDGLWFMDTRTNQIVMKMKYGYGILGRQKNGKIYQSQIFFPFVDVVDAGQMSIGKEIEVGGRPMNIAFGPDQKSLYVANYDLNEVEQIDTQTDSVVSRIPGVNTARGIGITFDGKFAYVTNVIPSTVTIVDLDSAKVVKTVSVGKMPVSVAMSADGKSAYIACQGNSSIDVLDTQKQELIKSISVGSNPIDVQIR